MDNKKLQTHHNPDYIRPLPAHTMHNILLMDLQNGVQSGQICQNHGLPDLRLQTNHIFCTCPFHRKKSSWFHSPPEPCQYFHRLQKWFPVPMRCIYKFHPLVFHGHAVSSISGESVFLDLPKNRNTEYQQAISCHILLHVFQFQQQCTNRSFRHRSYFLCCHKAHSRHALEYN